jgi:hypothetical protein
MDEAKLRRIQLIIAILGGTIGLIVGLYNFQRIFKKEDEPAPAPAQQLQPAPGGKLTSTLEDVGASWIKRKLAPDED